MSKFSNLKKGDLVVAITDFSTEFSFGTKSRLTEGRAYVVSGYDSQDGLWIVRCDAGHECNWGVNPSELFVVYGGLA